jgi:hypothetical protein
MRQSPGAARAAWRLKFFFWVTVSSFPRRPRSGASRPCGRDTPSPQPSHRLEKKNDASAKLRPRTPAALYVPQSLTRGTGARMAPGVDGEPKVASSARASATIRATTTPCRLCRSDPQWVQPERLQPSERIVRGGGRDRGWGRIARRRGDVRERPPSPPASRFARADHASIDSRVTADNSTLHGEQFRRRELGSSNQAFVFCVGLTKNAKTFRNVEHLRLKDGR